MADFDELVGQLDYPMLIVTANDGHRRAGCLVGSRASAGSTHRGTWCDKFARCAWRNGPDDVPLLTDCPQWFVGRVLSWHDTGDHEGVLLEPTAAGDSVGLGQLGFQAVHNLDAGNEA